MHPRTRKHGYVLVMTLVLLSLTTLALAGTVRLSLRRAAEANFGQSELQRRWGAISCQYTLLPQAESIIQIHEAQTHRPAAAVRRTLVLGNMAFELIFGDEQAKANVNILFQRRGKEATERLLREILIGSDFSSQIRLRPTHAIDGSPVSLPPIGIYGQAVRFNDLNSLLEAKNGPAFTDAVTCWGDGRVNFQRADERILRAVASSALNASQVDRLLHLRRESPKLPLPQALSQLQLTASSRAAAQALIAGGSACHSLWIITRVRERTAYRLAVRQGSTPSSRADVFEW